jgi:hypothetical protein
MATVGQSIVQNAGGGVRCGYPVTLTVPAQANTDFTFNIPVGARNVIFSTVTVSAFGAATDAQLQIGKTVGGAEYVAATSIKALGKVTHTLVATNIADLETVPASLGGVSAFTARIVQTGTASATGQATLFIEYTMLV